MGLIDKLFGVFIDKGYKQNHYTLDIIWNWIHGCPIFEDRMWKEISSNNHQN